MNIHKLVSEAVQYGFKYYEESQHDGQEVPQGNIDQWLMWKLGNISKEEFQKFKEECLK